MEVDSKVFLRKKFMQYYASNNVPAPYEIEKREFGVGTLESKIKLRHKSFRTKKELGNYLRREAPFYISYSTAYYEFPENQPMSAKNWLGADLVFDLDMPMDFLNSEKMLQVKEETVNLMDFLLSDFGFSKKDIEVNFSGGKGYHLKVFDEHARCLDGDERREIVDYVTGTGLDLTCFVKPKAVGGHSILAGPGKDDPGWAGRIYDATMDLLESDVEKLRSFPGIGPKKARKLYESREQYIKGLDRNHWADFTEDLSSSIQQRVLEENAVGLTGDTDKMVTIDTSRLIRLPDTLHGGSGLLAKRVKDLESFDPLTSAVVFGEENTKIMVKEKIPSFDLNGQVFKFEKGKVEAPEYVAVYLLLKDKAEFLRH